jgi:hypothetical protein
VAIVRLASGEASFTVVVIAPADAALVAVNRRISSIRLDDGTDDDSGGFRGCFISHPQKFSYIDGVLPGVGSLWGYYIDCYLGPSSIRRSSQIWQFQSKKVGNFKDSLFSPRDRILVIHA